MRYFIVSANYSSDPKIQKVGERGEILFLRGLEYCTQADSEGFIPETQLVRFGLRQLAPRVAALVLAGLWDKVTDGYLIRNWCYWQSEAYALGVRKSKDRARQNRHRNPANQDEKGTEPADSQRLVEDYCHVTKNGNPSECHVTNRIEVLPLPPPSGGCQGQHENCRGCRTTRRQQAKADRLRKPPWCGECNEPTRQVDHDSDRPTRCPRCHPLRAVS